MPRDGSPAPRIAVFTHDAYGLGHVRRCLHIVQALAQRAPHAAILFITGSPAVDMLKRLPPNTDYVKIPTVVTSGVPGTKPPILGVGLAEVSRLRSRLIQEALVTFAPDVFLVDNFPLGSRLELLASLHALWRRRTRIVLGLRDVADPPEKVRSDWGRDGLYEVLDRYYDRILIYGVPEVLDAVEAYALPPGIAAKVHYCGYTTAEAPPSRSPAEVRAELALAGPLAVATVGGGGDGFPLLQAFLEALPRIAELSGMVVTGEFMSPADRAALGSLAVGRPRLVVRDYVPDLPSYMAAADVVVAMGGYNTVAEILALRSPAIIVPRTWQSGEHGNRGRAKVDAEQLVRAQALADLGLVDLLHPAALSPETLAERIVAVLGRRREQPRPPLNVRGLEAAAEQILALAGPAARRTRETRSA